MQSCLTVIVSSCPFCVCRFCNKLHFIMLEIESALGPNTPQQQAEAFIEVQDSILEEMRQTLELVEHTGTMGKCRLLIQAGDMQ